MAMNPEQTPDDRERQPLSERQLRQLLESRDRKMEDERREQSKVVGKVLLLGVAVVGLAIAGIVLVSVLRPPAPEEEASSGTPAVSPLQKKLDEVPFGREFIDFMRGPHHEKPPAPKEPAAP